MPELPEVETTRRGLEPLLAGRTIVGAAVRVGGLRWPIERGLGLRLAGRFIRSVGRRAKYLLVNCDHGTLILHLGMSGNLRVVSAEVVPGRHDHIDIFLDDGKALRFHDPRRFGALLWTTDDPADHPLLVELGPEPFAAEMDGNYLYRRSRGRKVPVKPFLMDQKIVVGVGNIYACEALFRAGIAPSVPAGRIGRERYGKLAVAVREVLAEAIEAGGTTIRDFRGEGGRPGYFARELQAYGREGETCRRCGKKIRQRRLGQRSTYYCPGCQK
jgi:formamidopyrimidine-DNA glycosylase